LQQLECLLDPFLKSEPLSIKLANGNTISAIGFLGFLTGADMRGFAVAVGSESLVDEIDKGAGALDDLGCFRLAAVEIKSLDQR
jgi:hypothetical protein